MKFIFRIFLLVCCLCPLAAAAADMREDMVALDRALIPVLVLVSEDRPELASKAMRVARSSWYSFKEKYSDLKTADADWRRDINRADALVYEAYAIIDGGRQVALAREPLERATAIMTNLRRRNKFDYYFDHVLAFREPLIAMISAAEGKTPPDQAAGRIRAVFGAARKTWERALAAELGREYRWTVSQREILQSRLALETAALDSLGNALATNDNAAIIAAALATKRAFADIYNSFGDFHALLWESETSPPRQK